MCPWPLGRTAARAHIPSEPQPGAWKHPEQQAGPPKLDQFLLRPASGVPHVRVPTDHVLPRDPQAAAECLERPGPSGQHQDVVPDQVAKVGLSHPGLHPDAGEGAPGVVVVWRAP